MNFSPFSPIASRGSLNPREYKAAAAGRCQPGYGVVGAKMAASCFGEVPSNRGISLRRSL